MTNMVFFALKKELPSSLLIVAMLCGGDTMVSSCDRGLVQLQPMMVVLSDDWY